MEKVDTLYKPTRKRLANFKKKDATQFKNYKKFAYDIHSRYILNTLYKELKMAYKAYKLKNKG